MKNSKSFKLKGLKEITRLRKKDWCKMWHRGLSWSHSAYEAALVQHYFQTPAATSWYLSGPSYHFWPTNFRSPGLSRVRAALLSRSSHHSYTGRCLQAMARWRHLVLIGLCVLSVGADRWLVLAWTFGRVGIDSFGAAGSSLGLRMMIECCWCFLWLRGGRLTLFEGSCSRSCRCCGHSGMTRLALHHDCISISM